MIVAAAEQLLDDTILDLHPGEEEDDEFGEIDMQFAAALLKDDGEAMIEDIVQTYNRDIWASQEGQDHPELKLEFSSMELGKESDSDLETPPAGATNSSAPASATSPAGSLTLPSEGVKRPEDRGAPLPQQPGLEVEERYIKIKGVGVFRRDTGQPYSLHIYPCLEYPAIPYFEGKPQVYHSQDHYDPTGVYTPPPQHLQG